MTENFADSAAVNPVIEPVTPLQRSRLTVEWVSYLLAVLTLMSLFMLGWQFCVMTPIADTFLWSQPWFWMQWSGHFFRACVGTCLFLCVRRYLRELHYMRGQSVPDHEELFLAIDHGWRVLKWSGIVMVAHAILLVLNSFGFLHLPTLTTRESLAKSLPSRQITVEFRQADEQPREGWTESHYSVTEPVRKTVFLAKEPVIETHDIEHATPIPDNNGDIALSIKLTSEGAGKLRRATTDHVGEYLAIIIDGKVVSMPVVKDPLDKHIMVTGAFTIERAVEISSALRRQSK